MVLLQNKKSSRKRGASNSFVSPFPQQQPPKIPKHNNQNDDVPPHQTLNPLHTLASVLADASCTLINSAGPPCLPPDHHKLRHLLHRRFSSDAALRSDFLTSLSAYIDSTHNLRRLLQPAHGDSYGASKNDSLVRVLLLVPSIQLDLQKMLLEKLPLYFDPEPVGGFGSSTSSRLDEDVARLILNQLRWLDFLVDSEVFTEKLLEVLSICPLHLKKEIIGSLPEIIGDQNSNIVINSLEQMLQNDSNAIIVPVLDCVTNFNLDDLLLEKVTTLALSYVRTIDAEHMPYLLKFLLLSATPMNAQKIIFKIREQLKNLGMSNISSTQHNKLKGKSVAENVDLSILDALRSSLRFKNMLCQELLKELKGLDKPQDHKLIDIWLLMLIYTNSEFMQKIVEKMFKKKVVEGCINAAMLEQCICGNKQLVQDFFASFLSLSEYLLASKEPKARELSIHMYKCLFEVFVDNYSRQEILGAIVTHVGSGNSFEVDSALEVMTLLASNYSRELLPLSSHISGILDYLEGFNVQSLHTVYEVFCLLALPARCGGETFGSSIANELLMIVRKQVSNPDLKYKRMGVIGSLKIVSFLGDVNNAHCLSSSQKSNTEEALELLKTSMDSCKQLPLPSIIFYDELIATLDRKVLHPDILEWIGKYVAEFESRFLYDLDAGKLSVKELYCGLEGNLWMNLDGDISPICLNILPLVSSSTQSLSLLQVLPAHFLLLSKIESLTNQGSLGGIDALLGCPLHLPSSKLFTESTWQSLSEKQKHILCLCLYYAVNWMRELINAFCTQVAGRLDSITTETEIITKLLKRLRNLVCLESLLNNSIKKCHISLPQLYPHDLPSSSLLLSQSSYKGAGKTNLSGSESSSQKRKEKNQKTSKASSNSDTNGTSRQPTIMEVLRKAGAVPSQDLPNEDSTDMSIKETASASSLHVKSSEPEYIDISMASKSLEVQRLKFRPLLVDCFSILSFSQKLDPCCADPAAELPLHLYLLRDLHCKLEYFSPSRKQNSSRCLNSPPGFSGMTAIKFLGKIRSLFPTLREHLDCAICILKEGDEACEEHWKVQSALAGNPDISNIVVSKTSVSSSVFIEILHCFSKMLNVPDTLMDKSVLSDLLQSFQPGKILDDIFAGMLLIPSSGSIEFLYLGAYSFLEEALDVATAFSFTLASEVLLIMESVVTSVRKFLDKSPEEDGKRKRTEKNGEVLPVLCSRLGIAAQKLLRHNWDIDSSENSWKRKGDLIQRTVHIYLENCESTSDLLDELAQSILPKVSLCRTTDVNDSHGFPTLCSATFVVWYRELHEENLTILNKLVKEAVSAENQRGSVKEETTEKLLYKLRQSVNVVVSLVNLCKVHDKVSVHAMSINYGGKFVDSFLKVFDFLQTQFEKHNEFIIELIKELQKATRTIQTLCSEAKSLKQTIIASKIPATKRSMERFLFQVKALFHTTARGCTFWMGNLKHKDLMGQVVSSQPYIGDEDVNIDDEPDDSVLEPATVANDEASEVE